MLDLDGTTIHVGSTTGPTRRVRDAITLAAQRVFVGIATGRPLFYARSVLESLPLTAPCVVNGGAQIYDPMYKSIVWEKRLHLDEVEKLHIIVKGHGQKLHLNDGLKDYEVTDSFMPERPLNGAINGLDEQIADTIIHDATSLTHLILAKVPSLTPGKIDININHSLATKQHGIFEVAKRLGVHPREIIGVGDSGNDLPLLMACGLKVAMGNGAQDLKAIADYVAPSVMDNGVADIIEKFVLSREG